MGDVLRVETSVATPSDAYQLGERLLKARLVACVQYLAITSQYWWDGNLETAEETLLVAKTSTAKQQAVCAAIEKHHPYETPEILVIPVTYANRAYCDWVLAETGEAHGL